MFKFFKKYPTQICIGIALLVLIVILVIIFAPQYEGYNDTIPIIPIKNFTNIADKFNLQLGDSGITEKLAELKAEQSDLKARQDELKTQISAIEKNERKLNVLFNTHAKQIGIIKQRAAKSFANIFPSNDADFKAANEAIRNLNTIEGIITVYDLMKNNNNYRYRDELSHFDVQRFLQLRTGMVFKRYNT